MKEIINVTFAKDVDLKNIVLKVMQKRNNIGKCEFVIIVTRNSKQWNMLEDM